MTGHSYVQPLVLVLVDDPRLRRFLVSALASHGFRSMHMSAGAPTLERAVNTEPDLVLLDVGRSAAESAERVARVRDGTAAPILILLELTRERDGAELLDAGASDYIAKPFSAADLIGRVRVWLRHGARASSSSGSAAPIPMPRDAAAQRLRIDRERRTVLVEGREVHLTPTECTLLVALSKSRGPMSEPELVEIVWGPEAVAQAQPRLRARVLQLRKKIELDPMRPRHLLTDGDGRYRLRLTPR